MTSDLAERSGLLIGRHVPLQCRDPWTRGRPPPAEPSTASRPQPLIQAADSASSSSPPLVGDKTSVRRRWMAGGRNNRKTTESVVVTPRKAPKCCPATRPPSQPQQLLTSPFRNQGEKGGRGRRRCCGLRHRRGTRGRERWVSLAGWAVSPGGRRRYKTLKNVKPRWRQLPCRRCVWRTEGGVGGWVSHVFYYISCNDYDLISVGKGWCKDLNWFNKRKFPSFKKYIYLVLKNCGDVPPDYFYMLIEYKNFT